MEFYLSQMRLILPILGFEFLDQQTQQRPTDEETEPQGARFTIRSSELDAKMIQTDDGLCCPERLAGSQIRFSINIRRMEKTQGTPFGERNIERER